MSCNFNCLDVKIVERIKKFYETQEIADAITNNAIKNLMPSEIILGINDFHKDDFNLIGIYIPLLKYLYKNYSLLWSSVVIWDPIIKDYYFRTVKTDKMLSSGFSAVHKFAETEYYKNQIHSLTEIIFKKLKISKPVILYKHPITNNKDDLITIDVSAICGEISQKLQNQNSTINENIIEGIIEELSQDNLLETSINRLQFPSEFSVLLNEKTKFLKYLIWLQMLGPEWIYYYYLPATFLFTEETGGQTIAVEKELNPRDITKIMIINGIIHEPISRKFSERMKVLEVQQKINLLEQTYHDINRRYIPVIENYPETNILAGLLENKISYLRLLAQGNREQTSPEICIKEEIEKIFSSLRFEEKSKFRLDVTQLNPTLALNGNKGAFISLFENLIGNTCRHSLSRNIASIKIQIWSEGTVIYYKDDGQGFPNIIDDIDILQKINLWFIGQFSENDMKQREEGKNIRGMGFYIVKQSADFLAQRIIPVRSENHNNLKPNRVQIIFKIEEI